MCNCIYAHCDVQLRIAMLFNGRGRRVVISGIPMDGASKAKRLPHIASLACLCQPPPRSSPAPDHPVQVLYL